MSTSAQTQHLRIEGYCKKIWGPLEFDFEMETDDHEYYMCLIREDRGLSFGPPLIMTTTCRGQNEAWHELERMLYLWAKQVESGKPMTQEERLKIFSGPNGEFRGVLETFDKHREAHHAHEVREKMKAQYLAAEKAINKEIAKDVAEGGDKETLKEVKAEVLANFKLESL